MDNNIGIMMIQLMFKNKPQSPTTEQFRNALEKRFGNLGDLPFAETAKESKGDMFMFPLPEHKVVLQDHPDGDTDRGADVDAKQYAHRQHEYRHEDLFDKRGHRFFFLDRVVHVFLLGILRFAHFVNNGSQILAHDLVAFQIGMQSVVRVLFVKLLVARGEVRVHVRVHVPHRLGQRFELAIDGLDMSVPVGVAVVERYVGHGVDRLHQHLGLGKPRFDLRQDLAIGVDDKSLHVVVSFLKVVGASVQYHEGGLQTKHAFVQPSQNALDGVARDTAIGGVQPGVVDVEIAKIGDTVAYEDHASLFGKAVFQTERRARGLVQPSQIYRIHIEYLVEVFHLRFLSGGFVTSDKSII